METAQHDKIKARMAKIDAMPADIRDLVHEFGLTIVDACLAQGVKKASGIRHLIQTIQKGSIEPGIGIGVSSGRANIHAGRTMCMIPTEPTPAMIHASMEEVTVYDPTLDKYEKHRRRLRAAIKAGLSRIA